MANKKYDFRKAIHSTTFSKPKLQNYSTEFYDVNVDIEASDKVRLERFFKEETGYYNHLVEGFSSRVRSFPEYIMEFDDTWQKIFGYVAETKIDLKQYIAKKDVELSQFLIPYKKQLIGHITDEKLAVCELAKSPGLLLPVVRRNMALETIRFYKEQAERILTPGSNANSPDGNLYKVAPEMLEVVDTSRKRHLQIPKAGIQLKWNEANESTELYTSYTAKPIVVPKINLIESHAWNHILVHQEPGRAPAPETPWVIDIRKISNNYMLKYLDVKNPFRSAVFNLNKRRS